LLSHTQEEGLATSPFLCFHFLSGQGLQQLGDASPGSAGRNRTLGIQTLEAIQVPVPPIEKQIWFDDLQAKVDALLPSILDKAFKGELV
jgi:type I restriction enzyme, S subunit